MSEPYYQDELVTLCEMTAARLGSWQHSVAHDGSLFTA